MQYQSIKFQNMILVPHYMLQDQNHLYKDFYGKKKRWTKLGSKLLIT